MTVKIETIEEHLEAAGSKLRDLVEIHLPAIEDFVGQLSKNPLVTALSAAIPGSLGAEAMAILNQLGPLLKSMGGGEVPAVPAPSPVSTIPEESPGTSGGEEHV